MGEVCQVKRIVDFYWLEYLWSALVVAATAFVVVRLTTSWRRIRQFPVFFAYAAWQLVSTLVYWALFFNLEGLTWLYSWYQVFQIGALASITAVLIDLYFKLKQRADWSHWIGLLAFVVGITFLVQEPQLSYYLALVTVFMLFNCALAVMVQWMRLRSRTVDLGRSYKRILFGLSLMLAFQTFLYSYTLLQVTPFPWMVSLAQPVSLAGWLCFVGAVARIELPRTIEDGVEEPVAVEMGLVAQAERVVAE